MKNAVISNGVLIKQLDKTFFEDYKIDFMVMISFTANFV